MPDFQTLPLAEHPDEIAPDGSEVRVLVNDAAASVAHFTLPAHRVAVAVQHRTVSEYWVVTGGTGRIWRSAEGNAEITTLEPGVSLTIPLGTSFQWRNDGDEPLTVIGFDLPPWPGDDEAFAVDGEWRVSDS